MILILLKFICRTRLKSFTQIYLFFLLGLNNSHWTISFYFPWHCFMLHWHFFFSFLREGESSPLMACKFILSWKWLVAHVGGNIKVVSYKIIVLCSPRSFGTSYHLYRASGCFIASLSVPTCGLLAATPTFIFHKFPCFLWKSYWWSWIFPSLESYS